MKRQPKETTDDSPSSQSGDYHSTPRLSTCPRHKNGAIRHSSMGCQTDDLAPLATPKERRKPKKEKKHISLEAKREKKAAKTLAIVTGAFIICWLPFFVMALVNPLCDACINNYVFSFFLWLGYFNSTLNPIIYTVFSPEFRQAFKKILCGRASPSNYRPRHLQWVAGARAASASLMLQIFKCWKYKLINCFPLFFSMPHASGFFIQILSSASNWFSNK